MKLIRYGLTLRRIGMDDLEKVRNARNAVRHLMDYKEYITPEMQKKWFKTINNSTNYYYIIDYQNEDIGLIHEKNSSTVSGEIWEESEGGIFLFDEKYYNSPAPVLAVLILIEKGIYIFGDDYSIIHIVKGNDQALNFNKAFGYELVAGEENKTKQKYIVTKERFLEKTKKLRKAALRLSKSKNNLVVVLSKQDFETDFGDSVELKYNQCGFFFNINESGEKVCTVNFDSH